MASTIAASAGQPSYGEVAAPGWTGRPKPEIDR